MRDRLKRLQTNLDAMLANHQLTSDQYQTESERVRQLRLQMRVDAQENDSMTKEDRDTDFGLIRQIDEEAAQWVAANVSNGATSPNMSLSGLQSQYANLNNQYQNLDARYSAAVSAGDLPTAQTIRTQLDALRLQMDDVRSKMQQLMSAASHP